MKTKPNSFIHKNRHWITWGVAGSAVILAALSWAVPKALDWFDQKIASVNLSIQMVPTIASNETNLESKVAVLENLVRAQWSLASSNKVDITLINWQIWDMQGDIKDLQKTVDQKANRWELPSRYWMTNFNQINPNLIIPPTNGRK